MKLADKTLQVFTYVKENGGRISVAEMVEALDRNARSINASVTDLSKKELAVRDKVKEGDADVTYVQLTDAGSAFVQPTEAE